MHNLDFDQALRSWLAVGAPPVKMLDQLCEEMGKRLDATSLPIDQFALYTTMIHPEMPGTYVYWTKSAGIRRHSFTPEQLRSTDVWIGSAAQSCSERGRMIIHSLATGSEFDNRPETEMFAKSGYTHFVYTPLLSNYTLVNSVAAYGSRRPGKFTDTEIYSLRLLQGHLARIVETMVLHESTVQILSTYVGRDAGSRVLRGNILRGDAEVIPSVVLFADLSGFTALSNSKPVPEVIDVLNTFFDAAGTAITENGGEILKFMGDGLLAIFPTPDDINAQLAAAMNAVSAIGKTRELLQTQSKPSIRFRAALDVGDIHYGNIGSSSRLDFTAIGATVNRAARLLSLAEELGSDTVCSASVSRLLPGSTNSLGYQKLKGFASEQEVFQLNI